MRIIKFGANWCGPCRVYENILKEFRVDHPEVEIKEINVEDESSEVQELVSKYGVKNIPLTIFQFADRDEEKRAGLITRNELEIILNSEAKCQN